MPLHPRLAQDADELGHRFRAAEPFPHIVIDDFLDPAFAQALLDEFPAFEAGNYVGDDGKAGDKSTHARIRRLGPRFAELDALIQTPDFLSLVGRITQIDGLLYDPFYLGGGTHENRHGATLDAHLDFNYHPSERWHRRLNLIVYLNPEWSPSWGGALELYRDPRAKGTPDAAIVPAFNRCVIFETSERSWHGFNRITLPEEIRNRSRKSVALYFYTHDRPAAETAGRHSTIYVKRPLPEYVRPGHTLTADEACELSQMILERDRHADMLYAENAQLLQAQDRGLAGKLLYLLRRAYVRYRR